MINNLLFDVDFNKKELDTLFNAIKEETKVIGYYSLPNINIDSILEYEKSLENIDIIAVIGIGGSSLGAKAVYYFLKPTKNLKKKRAYIFREYRSY